MKARSGIWHLFLIPVAMFGFGYLMVPIYDVFCDLTGLNGKTGSLSQAQAQQLEADEDRLVKVEFISSLNRNARWEFRPDVGSMMVQPGKSYVTSYTAVNQAETAVVGQAIPSVAPGKAANYFNKTECFCFVQQEFSPNEARQLDLVFVVDPALPDDINTVTLSYTLFDVNSTVFQKPFSRQDDV